MSETNNLSPMVLTDCQGQELRELILDWKETARNYRGLAKLNYNQKAEEKGYKHFANMLEACVDELETLINKEN